MNDRYAVIDLGTNTFHLLVVEKGDNGYFKELHRERRFIKLAENGIEIIGQAPFERGLEAMVEYGEIVRKLDVKQVRALGTAALRTAKNGPAFIREVMRKTGIEVDIISGDEEAALIHNGILQAVPMSSDRNLIMDIGGGSVEFIIADELQVYWAESFPAGVAVLKRQFHREDPISEAEIARLRSHLTLALAPLLSALKDHPVTALVGASGTFDVLELNLAKEKKSDHAACVGIDGFFKLYQKIIPATLAQRLDMPKLPRDRADMIVVALELLKFIIEKAEIESIIVSSYALKEGALHEMMENKILPD